MVTPCTPEQVIKEARELCKKYLISLDQALTVLRLIEQRMTALPADEED
jgi:hypothetical protein